MPSGIEIVYRNALFGVRDFIQILWCARVTPTLCQSHIGEHHPLPMSTDVDFSKSFARKGPGKFGIFATSHRDFVTGGTLRQKSIQSVNSYSLYLSGFLRMFMFFVWIGIFSMTFPKAAILCTCTSSWHNRETTCYNYQKRMSTEVNNIFRIDIFIGLSPAVPCLEDANYLIIIRDRIGWELNKDCVTCFSSLA